MAIIYKIGLYNNFGGEHLFQNFYLQKNGHNAYPVLQLNRPK